VAYAASYVEWFGEEATRANGDIITGHRPPHDGLEGTGGRGGGHHAVEFPGRDDRPQDRAGPGRRLHRGVQAGRGYAADLAGAGPPGAGSRRAGWRHQHRHRLARAHPEVVDVWLADGRVRKISFTGSTAVGKHLARHSADTLKKLSLELGGNAPFIVFDDADVDAAIDGVMAAKFRNGGQTCVSPNRIYVQEKVYDAFVAKLGARVAALKVGPATDPASQIGPMINARAIAKIDQHVRDAIGRGARVITGGKRLQGPGFESDNYYAPTVLANVTGEMQCSCEETFGPVAPTRFATEEEVIAAANATPFGLAAYFYSTDVRRIHRVTDALESGIVGVNEGALAAEAALGGVKESGYGREGSVHGLDDYLHTKYVCQGQL
jgi:succinate-semialdehyde dehydrogenase/glutarate-semialdehyde dehydrogenase